MGEKTLIGWCHHTFNIVWGCVEVSAECANCYAREWAKRCGFDVWGKDADRRTFGEGYWEQPYAWDERAKAVGEKRRVFCSSMADVFEDHPTVNRERAKLWPIIEETPNLIWLLLTKRPENMIEFAQAGWAHGWPENVVAMTTAGTQAMANKRIPDLLKVPAKYRAISCEPMLEAINFFEAMPCGYYCSEEHGHVDHQTLNGIHQIIFGGESGGNARILDVENIYDGIAQCARANVKVFVKQLGSRPRLNGRPLVLQHKKGEDPSEWPGALRIQEFPV